MRGEIIVGYDGRDPALDAVVLGRMLAALAGGPLSVAVALPYDPVLAGLEKHRRIVADDAERLLERARPLLEGAEIEVRASGGDSAARMLHDLAERQGAAAIVLGSTQRGPIGRLMLGSVAERLLAGAPCAVAVAPRGFAGHPEPRLESIGVGFESSEEARAALAVACELAAASGAELRLYGVVEPQILGSSDAARMAAAALAGEDPERATKRERELESEAAEAIAGLPDGVRGTHETIVGNPGTILVERTANVDLMVVGSRRYGPLRRVLLGDVSGRVMRGAECPVIAVPRGSGVDGRG